jgi:hypothetical protein
MLIIGVSFRLFSALREKPRQRHVYVTMVRDFQTDSTLSPIQEKKVKHCPQNTPSLVKLTSCVT